MLTSQGAGLAGCRRDRRRTDGAAYGRCGVRTLSRRSDGPGLGLPGPSEERAGQVVVAPAGCPAPAAAPDRPSACISIIPARAAPGSTNAPISPITSHAIAVPGPHQALPLGNG